MVVLEGTAAIAIGSAVAIAAGALGTAWAQGVIGSAAMGLLAERPEKSGNVLILMALPETIIVLSFVVAFLLVQKLTGTG